MDKKSREAIGEAIRALKSAGWGEEAVAQVRRGAVEPSGAEVAIHDVFRRLQEAFAGLGGADAPKVVNALEDVGTELAKPQPDRQEVGQALERAVRYVRRSGGSLSEEGMTALKQAALWLGEDWLRLYNQFVEDEESEEDEP
jgi:hypothetical protein